MRSSARRRAVEERLVDDVGRFDDSIEVAGSNRSWRIEHLTEQRCVEAAGCEAVPGELGGEDRQTHPDRHLVEPDLEIARGADAHVAREQQQRAGRQRMARARAHDRHRAGEDAHQRFRAGDHERPHLVLARGHDRQVEASREPSRPAGEQDSGGAVVDRPRQTVVDRGEDLVRERVGLAVVEPDDRDRTVVFE